MITVGGLPVVALQLERPRVGVWVAEAQVNTTEPIQGAVDVSLGAVTLRGTVVRGADVGDRVSVRVVGGAGGLGKTVAPRWYRDVPVRVPLQDLMREVGETLSLTVREALLGRALTSWTRPAATAGECLGSLLAALDVPSWRVLEDGTVWLGEELWPSGPVAELGVLIEEVPTEARRHYAIDDPSVAPGTTVEGQRVGHVTVVATAEQVRVDIWTEAGDATFSRLLAPLFALVRRWVGPRLDHLALYPAEVLEQGVDQVSVQLDDPRWPQLTHVPVRGLPGVSVRVRRGARVLVGWEGGNPSRPYVALHAPEALEEIIVRATGSVRVEAPRVDLGASPAALVARVGDVVQVKLPPLVGTAGGNSVLWEDLELLAGKTVTGTITSGSSTTRA